MAYLAIIMIILLPTNHCNVVFSSIQSVSHGGLLRLAFLPTSIGMSSHVGSQGYEPPGVKVTSVQNDRATLNNSILRQASQLVFCCSQSRQIQIQIPQMKIFTCVHRTEKQFKHKFAIEIGVVSHLKQNCEVFHFYVGICHCHY